MRRWLAVALWAYLTWVILTWTRTLEDLVFGAGLAAVVATVVYPLGDVAAPWKLLDPRRTYVVLRIVVLIVVGMVRANLSLSRRIWSPSRPLRPGMVVVPTVATTDGELTTVGILTSIVVDNQIVDLDRERDRLQYHAVWIDSDDPSVNRQRINGGLEDRLTELRG